MTFKVIDAKTGKEPTSRVIDNIARKGGLMTMDIDQFFVGEDGSLVLVDDCRNMTYCDSERFKVVANKEVGRMKVVLDKGAYEPIRAHDTDAGLDLRTPIEFTIRPHDSCVIDTGVHIELPRGTFGQLFSKSGLNVKRSIVSLGGTIDEGYTGSITVKLYNEGDEEYHFRPGDKIVQLVIMPYLAPEIEYVNELGNTDRGDNGFGSTGK